MEKYTENKEDTKTLSSASAKKTRRGKECGYFSCVLIRSKIVKAQLLGYIFLNLPQCPQSMIVRVTW